MNSSFIHADIFFYVTTIAVIILTSLLIILFYYLVQIARHLEHTAMRFREESDNVMEDVEMIRESIKEQGGRVMSVLRFISGSFLGSNGASSAKNRPNKKGKSKSRGKTKTEDSEN